MAVVGVSATVAVFALEVHERLASYFIWKLESEIGQVSNKGKKKVTYVAEPSSDSKEYRRRWRSRRRPDSG